MIYQRIGLVITLVSASLALLTYLALGLHPLLALWVGLAVTGISMAITPPEPYPRNVSKLITDSFENIERIVEALNITQGSIFVPSSDGVYLVLGPAPIDVLSDPSLVRQRFVIRSGGSAAIVLRIPLPNFESRDVCSAIEEITVDTLGIATWIECVANDDQAMVKFHGVQSRGFSRLSRVVGSIHAIMAASALAILSSKPTRIVEEREEGGDIIVKVGVEEWK